MALAWNALQRGDTVEARARLEESFELARRIEGVGIGGSIINLGWVELLEGNLDAARACFEDGASAALPLGRRNHQAEALWGLAHVAAADSQADRAARLAGAAAAIGSRAGFDPSAAIPFAHYLDDARADLGEDAWQNAWDDGAALDLGAALELAQ